jgi:hypothetical protein
MSGESDITGLSILSRLDHLYGDGDLRGDLSRPGYLPGNGNLRCRLRADFPWLPVMCRFDNLLGDDHLPRRSILSGIRNMQRIDNLSGYLDVRRANDPRLDDVRRYGNLRQLGDMPRRADL